MILKVQTAAARGLAARFVANVAETLPQAKSHRPHALDRAAKLKSEDEEFRLLRDSLK